MERKRRDTRQEDLRIPDATPQALISASNAGVLVAERVRIHDIRHSCAS